MSGPRRYATTQETAEYIGGIHHLTVTRWIREGRLPAYRIGPKQIRVDLNDVDAILARPVHSPTSFTFETREASR